MPAGIHLKPARTFRPDSPELYEKAKDAVHEVGSSMNEYINGFLRWLTHETDDLPHRPPAKSDPSGETPSE